MSKQYTYEQIAADILLWNEYVNPDANMTDEEFEALTTEEKIAIQVECFGEEGWQGQMSNVKNEYGKELDFDAAVILMDDDIRESIHMEMSPCTEQAFFDAYVKAHQEKYGEEWELAKANPVW